ncbi:uncharacterized protein LOC121384503 [Gigantopelta aegis]|uniref:uncharacterized protein LOC121384503 n=1 Tax=Gigantopelta aegis TaxID=1735272 RepID=UPI001B88DA04|nr:uncharacterized protein LOC121384503 [Gigantopelta aegis]
MPHTRKRKNSPPPPSREAEHRRIHEVIHRINSDIKRFHSKFLNDRKIDYVACSSCMDKLLEDWQMDNESHPTWKEFVECTCSNKVPSKVKSSEEYSNIMYICERARDFEIMIPNMRNELVSCIKKHVYKYCQSFEEDAQPMEIAPVTEYASFIESQKQDIDSKIDNLNHNILTYGETKSPFYKFVFNGQEHETLMEDITENITGVCDLLRKWIKEDQTYPERLSQEIQFNNSYKETLQDDIRKLSRDRKSKEQQIERLERSRLRVLDDYQSHKNEKTSLKRRVEVVEQKLERLSNDKEKKNKEITELEETRSKRGPMSPRDRSNLDMHIDKCRADVDKINEDEKIMNKQLKRLRRQLKQVSDRTYELKVEAVTNRHKQYELQQEITGIDIEINSLKERIQSIDEKNEVIKKIRNMKLSPATLREKHFQRKKSDNQPDDNLEEACKFAAVGVASDWKQLYERLPFIPARTKSRRKNDLQTMDLIGARRDWTDEEQAMKSLEKWRTFNRRGDVVHLIKALRKIRKVDVARMLESKYMVTDVYS